MKQSHPVADYMHAFFLSISGRDQRSFHKHRFRLQRYHQTPFVLLCRSSQKESGPTQH